MNPTAEHPSQEDTRIRFYFLGIEDGSNFWTVVYIILGCIMGILFVLLVYVLGRKKYNEKKLVRLIVDEEIEDEEEG